LGTKFMADPHSGHAKSCGATENPAGGREKGNKQTNKGDGDGVSALVAVVAATAVLAVVATVAVVAEGEDVGMT
jgi:hypothetical protein